MDTKNIPKKKIKPYKTEVPAQLCAFQGLLRLLRCHFLLNKNPRTKPKRLQWIQILCDIILYPHEYSH